MNIARLGYYAVRPVKAFDRALYEVYARRRTRGIRRFLRENPSAVILASYPKSGNTLFRAIWLKILALQGEASPNFDYETLDSLLPNDQYLADLNQQWNYRSLPCLLKTHLTPRPEYAGRKIVHIVRNPLDTMVSNYHYFSARRAGPAGDKFSYVERRLFNALPRNERPFPDFLRAQFPYYIEHLLSWIREDTIPTAYERLTDETHAAPEVSDILSQLSLPVALDLTEAAIAETRPEGMRAMKPSSSMAQLDGMHFVRDTRTGQWNEIFSRDDLSFVQQQFLERGFAAPGAFPARYRGIVSKWPEECFA